VSVAPTREDLIQEYILLQQKALEYVTDIEREVKSKDQQLPALLNSIKAVADPVEDLTQINLAQVAINTKQIKRIMTQIKSYATSPGNKISAFMSVSRAQTIGAPVIVRDATVVIQGSENLVEPEDINAQATNYLTTMVEAEAIGGELESYAGILYKNKKSGPAVLQNLKSLGEKVKNSIARLAGRAKEVGESLWKTIIDIPSKVTTAAKDIQEMLVLAIKNIADKLREFFVALIGAIFDLAAWVQSIALKKNFTIREFAIEIQPLEVNLVWGIPISKFQTPKLTVSFNPQTPPQTN